MNSTPDLTVAAIKMILALAVVLAFLWAAHRWLKRTLPSGNISGRQRLIKVISNQPLGMKKSVALVQVPGKVLVLGIGAEQINLLTLIDDPNVLADPAMHQEGLGGVSFREQLRRMTRTFKRSAEETSAANEQGGMR